MEGVRSYGVEHRPARGVHPTIIASPPVPRERAGLLHVERSTNRGGQEGVAELVEELRELGVVRRSRARTACISPVFAVPKSSGGSRLIIDMRQANTLFPAPPRFRLSRASDVQRAATQGDLALHVDLTSGYYQVKIHHALRRYFTFVQVERCGSSISYPSGGHGLPTCSTVSCK